MRHMAILGRDDPVGVVVQKERFESFPTADRSGNWGVRMNRDVRRGDLADYAEKGSVQNLSHF